MLDALDARDSVVGDTMGAVVLAVIFTGPSGETEDERKTMGEHDAVVDVVSA